MTNHWIDLKNSDAILAIGWCVVITVAGYAWSTAIYERKSVN